VELRRAGYSWEVLYQRLLRRLAGQSGWLVFGFTGAVVLLSLIMLRPFGLYNGVTAVRQAALWLAAWLLAFTELYLVSAWLSPRARGEDADLGTLPLPAGQFFLHRLLDLAGVPLTNMLASLPLFGVALMYFGLPYGQSADTDWRLNWSHYPYWSGEMLTHDHDPWKVRLWLMAVNIAVAALLPLALGLLLDLAMPWTAARVVLLPGLSLGAYFLVRTEQVRFELFRIAYQQSRGYSAWTFIAVGACMVLLPYIVARMGPRARMNLAGALGVVLLLGVGLVFAQHQLPGLHTTALLRDALGDMRYALAYFFCHLSPAENIDLLCYNYPTNVLFSDNTAHNLIPRHLALWVGAGLYPPALCLAALSGMWLGAGARGRLE
jgi:hypothetical protein